MLVSIIFVERIRCMGITSNCAKLPLLKFKFIKSKYKYRIEWENWLYMTICDVLKLLEFFTDMQFLEFSFEVFLKINLSSLKISWYKCFGHPNFRLWIHNKLQHKTHETVDEIGMPKFSPKFDH